MLLSDSSIPTIPGSSNHEISDEQVYCVCQEVSYGEMIACDGKVLISNLEMQARMVSPGMRWTQPATNRCMVLQ